MKQHRYEYNNQPQTDEHNNRTLLTKSSSGKKSQQHDNHNTERYSTSLYQHEGKFIRSKPLGLESEAFRIKGEKSNVDTTATRKGRGERVIDQPLFDNAGYNIDCHCIYYYYCIKSELRINQC